MTKRRPPRSKNGRDNREPARAQNRCHRHYKKKNLDSPIHKPTCGHHPRPEKEGRVPREPGSGIELLRVWRLGGRRWGLQRVGQADDDGDGAA